MATRRWLTALWLTALWLAPTPWALAESRNWSGLQPLASAPAERIGHTTLTLVQVWASWCGGCSGVAEALADLGLDPERVQRLGISIDRKREDALGAVARIARSGGRGLVLLHDADGRWAERHAVNTAPTLLLLDGAGKEHWRVQGHPSASDLSTLVATVETLSP